MKYLVLRSDLIDLDQSDIYIREFWSYFGINGTLDKIVLCYILEV